MKHPYFTEAYQTELKYVWETRTSTGVLEQRPFRGRQTWNLSAVSSVKTPNDEPTLLFRAMDVPVKCRSFSLSHKTYLEKGDFGPEYYHHFKGSEKFNALVKALRKRSILAKDNATAHSRGIYETETC